MAVEAGLARRFLLGTSTPEEDQRLEAGLAEDPQAAADLLDQVRVAFEGAPPAGLSPLQWAEADATVKAGAGGRARLSLRLPVKFLLAPVVVVLLVGAGWYGGVGAIRVWKHWRAARKVSGSGFRVSSSKADTVAPSAPTASVATAIPTAVPTAQIQPETQNPKPETDVPLATRATPAPEEPPTESGPAMLQDQTEPLPSH